MMCDCRHTCPHAIFVKECDYFMCKKFYKFFYEWIASTCWKPTIEALKQGVKSAQSKNKNFTICTHRICGVWSIFPACLIPLMGIYMPKVNNRNTRRSDKVWNQFKSKNKDFLMTSVLVSLSSIWGMFNACFQVYLLFILGRKMCSW